MKITNLKQSDWEKAKSIRLEALQTDPQAFSSTYLREIEYSEEKWKSRLTPWAFYALDENNNTIGSVGAFLTENGFPLIVAMYVTPNQRGKGVGSELLNQLLIKIAYENKYDKIFLSVNKEQESAVALYKKFGFKIINEDKTVLGDGKEHYQLNMVKLIRPSS